MPHRRERRARAALGPLGRAGAPFPAICQRRFRLLPTFLSAVCRVRPLTGWPLGGRVPESEGASNCGRAGAAVKSAQDKGCPPDSCAIRLVPVERQIPIPEPGTAETRAAHWSRLVRRALVAIGPSRNGRNWAGPFLCVTTRERAPAGAPGGSSQVKRGRSVGAFGRRRNACVEDIHGELPSSAGATLPDDDVFAVVHHGLGAGRRDAQGVAA